MIRQRDIRGFYTSFHRNGSSGESFNLCSFRFRQGQEFIELRAVVFAAKDYCAVFSGNCSQRWSGDDFEPALREAIALQEVAQPERAYAR